jgi:hypothetical protein
MAHKRLIFQAFVRQWHGQSSRTTLSRVGASAGGAIGSIAAICGQARMSTRIQWADWRSGPLVEGASQIAPRNHSPPE